MTTFEENISKYFNWTIDYTNKVIYEYERFLYLKANNLDIIPSNDIYKLWKYHILIPTEYYNYCISKYSKIIDFNPNQKFINNYINIFNTLTCYKNTFGNIIYNDVWIYDIKINIEDIGLLENKSVNNIIPSYIENKPQDGYLTLYFVYNKQSLIYKPFNISESVNTLIDMISKQINISHNNINIKLHPEINIVGYDKLTYINNGILRTSSLLNTLINKSYNFFVVELINQTIK